MPTRDPYDVLGVKRSDDDAAIRRAYRKLAKRHHPDMNAGKPEAVERFKEINAANDLLSDPARRARFDRGEIDGAGNEAPRPTPRDGRFRPAAAGAGHTGAGHTGTGQPGFDFEDLDQLFGQGFAGRGAARGPRPGGDVQYSLAVDFLDAARGAVRRLALPDGRTLDVTIPAGLRDGHVLRLRGQGRPGREGGPAGDALVEVTVTPHPFFRREGDDIVLRLPITLREAVLGASVEVPTLRGKVRLAIPAGSANGARLRLRGRGIDDGHQFVELDVTLPPGPEPALAAFLRDWTPTVPLDPRRELDDSL